MASPFDRLDSQMKEWAARLMNPDELGLGLGETNRLATSIAADVRALPEETKQEIRLSSNVTVSDRIDELVCFQSWMDFAQTLPKSPGVTRTQVIAQNYICFVYLGDALFKVLKRSAPAKSTTRRCSAFLIDNPVRAFRNAIAHANWRYLEDFSGLEFWARKGADVEEEPVRWEVSQDDLSFWQALARTTAYASLLSL